MHYNINKICKGFRSNEYLFLISQMPRFKHCIFSIFKLTIFLFLLSIFLFLHFYIAAFLYFPFSNDTPEKERKGNKLLFL